MEYILNILFENLITSTFYKISALNKEQKHKKCDAMLEISVMKIGLYIHKYTFQDP